MQSLGDRIPRGGLDADATLEAILEWVSDLGLELYDAQEEAILELTANHHVVLATPTGSGKSMVAIAMHALHLASGERSVYTAPIKALVSEKFFALCDTFGADRVGMMTGDATINRDADILCCTAEVLEKIALRHGDTTPWQGVVMDEFHYYGDRDRGMAWQVPLLTMTHARFLLMSATLGPTAKIRERLEARTGRTAVEIGGTTRPVPLEFEYAETPTLESIDNLVRSDRAPIYAVHFTQREATELAQGLLSADLAPRQHKDRIKALAKGFRFDTPFGKHLRRMVHHGIGLHHAGLLPKYRLLVEKLAQQGLFRVICGTDTLGVGINVPIRTVLFTQMCKFDGHQVNLLSVRDFQQIAGRAGRKGYDDSGLVVAQAPAWIIQNARTAQRVAAGKKKKPKVKAQPPTRGYKHWDEDIYRRMVASPPERLKPAFDIDHGVVLALLRRAQDLGTDPADEIDALVDAAHTTRRQSEELRATARRRIVELVNAGIAEPVKSEAGIRYTVYDDLQDDFSLYHALSLFLLHLVGKLDPDDPDYALDVLTCVESILEHPKVVLSAQVRRDKGHKIAELKAAGVPYEERMEALEEVTWPKPKGRWLYDLFEGWRVARPWLAGDPVRPKSVVREMVEKQATFNQTIQELAIDRSEGVLLRYISQVYSTLVKNVPLEAATEPVEDVIAFLRAMLARVDDSLISTWQEMLEPAAEVVEVELTPDVRRDMRAFKARIRAELHAVVRALAIEDWNEAEASTRQDGERPFHARAFRDAMKPFDEAYGRVAWDGRSKQAWNTVITEASPTRWTVSQKLLTRNLDADVEEESGFINGMVDISDDLDPSGPVVQVVGIEV